MSKEKELILRTINLTKKYDSKIAVDNVNMTIHKGDIYGFIGKNGAGKTTLMKMVLGLTLPNNGEIELYGSAEGLDSKRIRIGSLIEAPGLYKGCTAKENMKRFSILFDADESQIDELLHQVGLGEVGKKNVGEFSLGMKQRLGIAIALLGNPDFLVLDEPINGLDPQAIKEFRDTIIKINKERGVTFLISSHLLSELSKIATVYGIIDNGKLVEEISAEDLEKECQTYIKIKVDNPQLAKELLEKELNINNYNVGEEYIFIYERIYDSALINSTLVKANVAVYELTLNKRGYEEFFIERIGNDEKIN